MNNSIIDEKPSTSLVNTFMSPVNIVVFTYEWNMLFGIYFQYKNLTCKNFYSVVQILVKMLII